MDRGTRVYLHVLRNRRNVKIHRMAPFSFFFFLSSFLSPILAFLTMAKPTNEHVRSAQTHKCIRRCVSSGGWSTPGWLAGWLPRHSSVNFNVLCHDLSRVSARLSPCLGRSSLPLFTPSPLPPVVVSLVRSLARSLYFREGLISLLSRIQCGK